MNENCSERDEWEIDAGIKSRIQLLQEQHGLSRELAIALLKSMAKAISPPLLIGYHAASRTVLTVTRESDIPKCSLCGGDTVRNWNMDLFSADGVAPAYQCKRCYWTFTVKAEPTEPKPKTWRDRAIEDPTFTREA
jgi:hypothetical protein